LHLNSFITFAAMLHLRKLFWVSSLVLAIGGNKLLAQSSACKLSLSGSVTDRDTKENLPYAAVMLKGTNFQQEADSLGHFSFENMCAGTYILECSHIGCHPFKDTIQLQESMQILVHMPHNAHSLEHVMVCEKKDETDKTKVMATLQAQALFETRGQNLGESLKKLPGVSTLQTGASISKPVVHGMHSNRLLILNNGVRLEGQQWGSEHGPEIDPFWGNELSLIKGAASVRYGSDALAGVILVNPSPMPSNQKTSGELTLAGISNGWGGVGALTLQGNPKRVEHLSWRIQATAKEVGNVRSPSYWLKNTGMKEHNYSATLAYNKETFGLELFASSFNSKIGIFSGSHIGNLTDLEYAIQNKVPMDTAVFSYAIERPFQKINHQTVKFSVFYLTGIKGKLQYQFAFQNNHRQEWDKHLPLNDSLAALNLPEFNFTINTFNNDLVWIGTRTKGWETNAGLSWIYQNNRTEGRYFIPNFVSNNLGAFAIEKYKKGKWELEAGVRFDYKTQLANTLQSKTIVPIALHWNNVSFDLGANFAPHKNIQVVLNFGKAWRSPAINELYAKGLHHGAAAIEVGDQGLAVEQAYNTNLEFILKKSDDLFLQVSGYANVIQDYIYLQPVLPASLTISGAFPTFQYQQANALFMGGDLDLKYRPFHALEVSAKASLIRVQNLENGPNFPMIPPNRYEAGLSYNFGNWGPLKGNYLQLIGQFTDQQRMALSVVDYMEIPKAYFLLNANVGGKLKMKKNELNLGVNINNALNTKYRDYMDRFRYFSDALGINIVFKIQYIFNS